MYCELEKNYFFLNFFNESSWKLLSRSYVHNSQGIGAPRESQLGNTYNQFGLIPRIQDECQ